MPDLTPFSGTIGVIVGAAIALTGTLLTLRHQFRLEVLKDEQALRNTRRERLRQTYEVVLLTAVTMRQAAARLRFLGSGETSELRDKELNELFEKVTADLERAKVRLLLEQGTENVHTVFERVRNQFIDYQQLEIDKRTGDRNISARELSEQQHRIEQGVNELREAMLASLAPLDQPIRSLAQSLRRWWKPWTWLG